jgi:hypothetical protein
VAIVVGGLLVAANLTLFAIVQTETDPPQPDRPSAIEALYPEEGAVVRPQERIGVDLRDDLQGGLFVNNARIPPDQYTGNPDLGEIFFRPGAGQDLRELPEGDLTMSVVYWPFDMTEEQAAAAGRSASFTWRFKVG